jgi:SAM-dependent methyltransferase
MRPQRSHDFLNRNETILARHFDWAPLDFTGKQVLELGPGPTLGWGPYAIFRGAAGYVGCDPSYQPEIMENDQFINHYCLPMHRDLSALYGATMTFDDFITAMKTRMHLDAQKLLDVKPQGPFDIILSNSCLEHITPLDETLNYCGAVISPGGRMLHLVNFGNHKRTANPFETLYRQPREAYLAANGKHINLHRTPDVKRFLEQAGFEVLQAVYYSSPEFFTDQIDDYWTEKYTTEELFQKVVIYGCLKQPSA